MINRFGGLTGPKVTYFFSVTKATAKTPPNIGGYLRLTHQKCWFSTPKKSNNRLSKEQLNKFKESLYQKHQQKMEQSKEGKHKFIFIRHAESEYNAAMKNAIRLDRTKFEHEQDRYTKFCPELIDCGISQKGYGQCQALRQQLCKLNIKYVLTSPLKRALITSQQLFVGHPNKPQILIEPKLTQMLLSNCDIGGNILQSRTRMNLDFSFLDKVKYKKLWVLENIPRKNDIIKEIEERCKTEDEVQMNGHKVLVKLMDQHFPNPYEFLQDVEQRTKELKQLLSDKYAKMVQPGEEFVVIVHYRIAECMTATKFSEEHKPVDGLSFKNARINEVWI